MFSLDPPPALAREIASFEPIWLSCVLTGLMLSPSYQANYARLATLQYWTLSLARGEREVSNESLTQLLVGMDSHPSRANEDPAEDVFVSEVSCDAGAFRIFNGVYTGSEFHLQRLLETIDDDTDVDDAEVSAVLALLKLSETIAARCNLATGLQEESTAGAPIQVEISQLGQLGSTSFFTAADLESLEINLADLEPFVLRSTSDFFKQSFGNTELERLPVLRWKDGVRIPVPSTISIAARMRLAQALGPAAVQLFYDRMLARWLLFDFPRSGAKTLRNIAAPASRPEWGNRLDDVSAVLNFDDDKHAHLLVLQSRWSNRLNRPIDELIGVQEISTAVKSYASEMQKQIEADSGFSAGLTLVVHDSPGWTLELRDLSHLRPNWYVMAISVYTLSTLLQAPSFNLLNLWKLNREMQELGHLNIPVVIWPDMLVHWSVWEIFGFTFTPTLADIRGSGLVADTSSVAPLVKRIRQSRARHGVSFPSGGRWLVERFSDPDDLNIELQKRVFFRPLDMISGTLLGVVETPRGPWWVRMGRPPVDAQEQSFLYLLWQAVLEWLLRASASAEQRLSPDERPLVLTLLPIPQTITDGPDDAEFYCFKHEVRILFPADLMQRLGRVDNRSEIEILGWVLSAILQVRGETSIEARAREWASVLLADPDMKMIHLTSEKDPAFAVDHLEQKRRFRPLQPPDLVRAARWMDEKLASSVPDLPPPMVPYSDLKGIRSLLNAAVDVHWEKCRSRLCELDRTSTIRMVFELIEAVHRRRVTDERAARARRVYFDGSPELVVKLASERDHAFRNYRIVAEMALCTCPIAGGRPPGISDIDELAAEVATLTRMADFSDGVQRKLISGGITITPSGSIHLHEGASGSLMSNYLKASHEDAIADDEDNYSKLFDQHSRTLASSTEAAHRNDSDVDSADFERAIEAETNLTLTAVVTIAFVLRLLAEEDASEAPLYRKSELVSRVISKSQQFDMSLEIENIEDFLQSYALFERPRWDEPPEGFHASDIYPWLFERRLSLMVRPLVVLSDSPDPYITYGIRQIDVGIRYALLLLERGIWDKAKLRSKAARVYVDQEINRRGKAFEVEISSTFQEAGWHTICSIPMKQLGADKAMGEIDVLAISPDKKTWLIVECKWFGAARTPREIASWMQDFHGVTGDKLDKHLSRCSWIAKNQSQVAARLKIGIPITLDARIVTTRPVPLAFFTTRPEEMSVRTIRQLRSDLRQSA